MRFFTDPQKSAEKKLADTRISHAALTKRLAAAHEAVTECTGALHQLAVNGAGDAELASGEAKLHEAERRVSTLVPALDAIEVLLTTLEAEIVTMLDAKTRATTSAEIETLANRLERVGHSFDIAISEMAAITTKAATFIFEARGLEAYSTSSKIEVQAAIPIIAELLREHGRAVLSGLAAATLPTPEVKFVPTIPAKLVTVPLFATRAIKWTDAEGQLRYVGRYNDAELPSETAARALSLKACVPIDDPLRRQHKGTWPGHPNLAQCLSLDYSPVDGSQAPPIEPAQFERVNRGPSYELHLARGNFNE